MCSWIAFWNASFFPGTEIAGNGEFGDWLKVGCAGLARVLVLALALIRDPEVSIVVFGVVLLGPGTEGALGLALLDFLWLNGAPRNSRALFLVLPEDILS